MDRVEAAFWTSEQIAAYLDLLIAKADESWYPSLQQLDRVQHLPARAATVAQESAD